MSKWQPMETAPRDGTWILGCNDRGNQAVIIWSDHALDMGRILSGWIHPFSDGRLSVFWTGARAVGWMPLPRPMSPDKVREAHRRWMRARNAEAADQNVAAA